MADKKISALTGATTPLAGTEVLPIVQSGATVKVSVDNLTTGKTVYAKNVDLTAGRLFLDQDYQITWRNGATNRGRIYIDSGNTIGFESGASNTTRMAIDSSGNTTISTGNLVIGTSGKGIDFSATPGTGTSELFADYEEGTFTATLTCTSGTITLNSGQDLMQYTKIGRMVYISGQIVVSSVSSPSGVLTFNGLPFTVNGSLGELAGRGPATIVAGGAAVTVANVVGYFLTGGTTITIAKYAAGDVANMAGDVSSTTSFFISMQYVAA